MLPVHLISPEEAAIAGAAAAGSFVALLVRRNDWRAMLSWFLVGQISAFYLVVPLVMARGWPEAYHRPVGFFWGALGMLVWTWLFALSQKLSDDPIGTFTTLWRTFRGQGGEK